MKAAGSFLQKRGQFCLVFLRAWQALFLVAYCLVLSAGQPEPKVTEDTANSLSMSLLRELAPSLPLCAPVSQPIFRQSQRRGFWTFLQPRTFPLLTQIQISWRAFEGEGWSMSLPEQMILSYCAVPGGASCFCVRYELSFQHSEPDLWGDQRDRECGLCLALFLFFL